MTDLSRVFFEFSRTSGTKHNDKMAAIFMYGICAKATGTESLHPTLQHVADEGGREGIFYEVPACAAQICDWRQRCEDSVST